MDKLTRVNQKIFAENCNITEMGVFGSEGEGTPTNSKDPSVIQSLGTWELGWLGAILGALNPTLEDRNGLDFVITRQLAYLFQMGVPEWSSGTTYHIGSIVNKDGTLYYSLVNDNENVPVTNATNWAMKDGRVRFQSITSEELSIFDDTVIYETPDAPAGMDGYLPLANLQRGKKITLKNVGTGLLGIYPSGADKIDGEVYLDLSGQYVSATLVSDGVSNWYLI